jgi:hypothetical protein
MDGKKGCSMEERGGERRNERVFRFRYREENVARLMRRMPR